MKSTLATSLLPASLLIGAAGAQVNDDCSGALPASVGTTPFDNTGATTSLPPFSCEPVFGQADVWFVFNAPTSDLYVFETCGSAVNDTVIEVLEGDCVSNTVRNCNDDGCFLNNSTAVLTTAGNDYLIRIAGWNGAQGVGSLEIRLSPVPNDECFQALPVTVGSTNFDNSGASTSSPPFTCEPFEGEADIWYTFTAPNSANYEFELCGSTYDTVLELFDGVCTQTVLACSDDACGVQSAVTAPLVSGQDYQVRIGGWRGDQGFGTLVISEVLPEPLDLIAHYKLDETSGFNAADSSGNLNDGTYNNVVLGEAGADPNTGNSARFDGATATVDIPSTASLDQLRNDLSACAWVNVDGPIPSTYRIFSNSGPSGSWSFAITPNGLAFTTHAIQDYSGPATLTPGTWHHVCVVMDEANGVSFYLDGQFLNLDPGQSQSNSPSTEYHIGAWNPNFTIPQFFDGRIDDLQVYSGQLTAGDVMTLFSNPGITLGDPTLGTRYCDPNNPNSTGVPTDLTALGNINVALNDVTLVASDVPINSFGFFLVSRTQGFIANPAGSEGNLCLSGQIGRYVGPGQIQNSGPMGEFSLVLDLNMIPGPMGFQQAMPGDNWNFQGWHRDSVGGSATSNFTNGVSITFQ
ncbi:MAG: LamG domain-containing protein [Planctomycetota bacterium]